MVGLATLVGTILVAGFLVGLVGPAGAAKQKGTIKPAPDRGNENVRAARKLAFAMSTKRKYVRKATFSVLPPFGDPAAISTKRLAGFPRNGRSFAILSNGDATLADHKNFSGSTSTQLGGPTIRGSRDVLIHRTTLNVPKGARCLSFRFRFLTEEFPEYVNSEFNDAFIAELDSSNWNTTNKTSPKIQAPGNFAFDSKGNYISVNGAGDATVTAAGAKGTTYDGATRVLRASTPISPGRHILYLTIFDQGDRDWDSAVFVDGLTLDKRSPCVPGVATDK